MPHGYLDPRFTHPLVGQPLTKAMSKVLEAEIGIGTFNTCHGSLKVLAEPTVTDRGGNAALYPMPDALVHIKRPVPGERSAWFPLVLVRRVGGEAQHSFNVVVETGGMAFHVPKSQVGL